MISTAMPAGAFARGGLRSLAMLGVIALPAMLPAQSRRIQPLFEIFATYSRPPLPGAVADAYAASGGVRAGAGVGAAVGVMIRHVEVAGFYEIATTSLVRPSTSADSRDFTRYTGGLRAELPLPEFGAQFRGLVSGSVFVQSLGRTVVRERVGALPPRAPPPAVSFVTVSQSEAFGGRLEAGVEHRGFIGTTWFVTGGVALAGAGNGLWTANSERRGGVGFTPLVTLGLRTRDWAR